MRDCDANADCVTDSGDKPFCRCKSGFVGDGRDFCKRDVIGCNVIDNCGRFADCAFDHAEGGYRCRCDRSRVSKTLPSLCH